MELTPKNSIISELCRKSGKSDEALAANRAHSQSLSEAELMSLISGERKDLSKGLTLEHSEEVPESSNVERYSIEINGKAGEAEVTYNDSGYPVEIVERVEGQEVRRVKYKWNSGDKDSPAYVELTEERPDGSVRVTTALDADNEGKIKDTDFVCEQYKDKDENETVTYSIGGVMREEKLKKDGKSVTTLYNGTSYNAYKAGELHRYFQQTEKDGEVHYAEYDGKGNTYTVVQNGESPALIAQKFKVSTSSLMKLNPQKGRKAIDQVGARIRVPGEYNADSGVLKARLSAAANLKKYSEQEFKRTQERIYSSTVEETTLGKDYGGNYWKLASDLLGKGASKKEINDKALELEALNMKTNPKLRKGSKILITKASTDSKTVKELTALGFSAGAENNTFYKKYNALSGPEQQNVKSMLRYLKSQKITDKSRIKSEINRVYPNINLFDSDKIILNQGSGMFGTGNKFGRGNGIPLERFVSEYLGLNIHSKEGQEVYRRLNSLPQSELDKITANDYKSKLSSIGQKPQGLEDKSLKGVQRSLGKYGVEIRTSDEVRQDQQRYQMSPEYKANLVRQVAAEGAGIAYDRAIELIKAYQDNQGWLNVGYWREKLGGLLDLIVPENDYVAMNFDGVIRRLERERDYVKSALRTSSGSGSEFKRKFKELTGVEFDEGKVKEFLKLASKDSAKSGEAYAAAFGTKVLDSVSGQIQTVSITDGIGDIATMLVGTSWLKELGVMKKMIGGTTKAVGTLVKSGTVAQNISRGLAGAELLGTWTAGSGTVNNITMKRETSLEDWKNLAVNTAISSGVGFVGGITAESLSKVEKAVSDYANKLIGKSSTSASQMNVKAMEQILSSGKGMNGVELWGKFLKATSNTNIAGGAAKFAAEVGIFTGYDIGVEVVKDLVDEEGHLRASLKDPQELEAFLKERLGSQIQNLGLIKTIGHFIEMRLGGKYGSMLSDYEVLKRTNVKELNVNGVKKYVIEVDNGNRIIADSPQKVLQFFQSSLYAEVYAKNMKTSETSSERGGGNTGSKEQAAQLGAAKAEVEKEVPTLPATQQPVTPKVSLVTQPPTNVKSVKSTDAVSSQQNNTDINMAEKRAQLKEKLQNSAQATMSYFNAQLEKVQTKDDAINLIASMKQNIDGKVSSIFSKEDVQKMFEPYNDNDMAGIKQIINEITKHITDSNIAGICIKNILSNKVIQNTKDWNTISRFLNDKSAENTEDLIDCKINDRFLSLQDDKQTKLIQDLYQLKDETKNPLLNVDNIAVLAGQLKDLPLDNIKYLLSAKDENGNFILNSKNIPSHNIDALKVFINNKQLFTPEIVKYIGKEFGTKNGSRINGADLIQGLVIANPNITPEKCLAEIQHQINNKLIKNPELKELSNKYENIDINNQLENIEYTLDGVKDEKLLNYIHGTLNRLKDNNIGSGQAKQELENVQSLIDAYHMVNKDYVNISNNVGQIPYYRQFIKFISQKYPALMERLTKKETTIDKVIKLLNFGNSSRIDELKKDFEQDMLYGKVIDFCKQNPKAEISKYLYEKYFVENSDMPKKLKAQCLDLNKKYGVKVFPSSYTKEADQVMKYIDQELSEWKRVRKDDAVLPPVIDFLLDKEDYYNENGAYGKGTAGAFAESYTNNSISLKEMSLESVKYSIRHEIMHINKLQKSNAKIPDVMAVDENGNIDFANCKYREEFIRAGIDPRHIPYAYTNVDEFASVALEGDTNQYSKEFKDLLVSIGVPKEALNMEVINSDIKRNVEYIKNLEQNISNVSLVDYVYGQKSAQTVEAAPEKIQKAAINNPNTPPVEAGDAYPEMEETVAPFAKRLTQTPDIQDLTNSEIKPVILENGEFNDQGEFVSDGTYTKTETGNPMAKQETFKRYSSGDKKLANNFNELKTQVANLFGEKKLATFEEKRLKNFVEKHPELSVKDISEIFADFSHITENTRIDFRYFYKELNQVENLNNLKTNINQFNKFITSMKSQKRDKSNILQYVVTQVLNENNIQQGIASVEPETFAKNLKYFENIEPTLQSELVSNDIDFLMKPHDQKLIEKINLVNEYNKWASEKAQDGSIILIKKKFNYFQNISDKDFEQFKKNIELIKNLIKNNVTSVDIQYRILGSKDSKYTDLCSKMQEELGENFDYQYLYRFGNDNYNLKPVMKLINAFPETIKNMQAYKVYSLCNKYYSSNDESSKQNFLNTIEIIKKLPQLVSTGSRVNPHLLKDFLNNHKVENTDKIIEFLDLAEPQFLAKINLCKPNGNNSSSVIDFDKFFAPEHLNQIIECAKLHKQLPKEFLEYLNSENSNIYANSKHTFQYEIPPEELHNRIEVINQYKDKFSNKILEDIYSGNMGLNSKTLNLLLSIPSDFAELMASHYPQSFMEKIPQEVIDKFVDYVKKNKEDTSEETFQSFCNNLDNTFFYIFGNLTTEELESLSFQSIADLDEEALTQSAIQNLKNGIAATPKVIRDFIRKDVGFDFYADWDKLIKDSNYPSLIASLRDYTEADLQNIGSKTIVKYLEQGNYSTKSFNKENIEVWKTVPQDIKDKLADKAFNYLTSNSKIDVDMLKTKVESLKGKELFDEMDSVSLYSVLTNKSPEFDKYLDIIISRPNYNKNDINSTIYNLKKIQEQENPDWDFVSELSNNPNIDPKEIPSLLVSIHNNQGSGAQQKDLARSLIANKDVDNANIYFFMLSFTHSNKKLKTNDEKAILAKNLLQRNDIPQVDIPSLMTLIKGENPTIVRKFIEDLIDQKALKVDQITKLFNIFNDRTYSAINEKIQLTRNFLFTKNMELSDVEKILGVLRDITNPKVMNDINILVEQIWNKYPEKNIDDIIRFCGVYSVSEQISNIKTELAKELIKNPRIQLKDISLLLSNCRNENSKNFILQSLNEQKLNYSDISKVANAISYNKNIANKQIDLVDYMTEQENYSMTDIPKLLWVFLDNQVISPEILENKIKDFVSAGVDTDLIIDICSNANAISIFNNDVVNILKRLKDNGSDIKGIVQLISTGLIPTELKDRIDTLLTLSYFTTEDKIILKKQGVDINNKITILMKMIDSKYPIVETSQENVINFLQHIGNSEKADATIQEADFTQFGETGIKLQYSRDEFIQNMDKIISEAGYKTQEYSTEDIEIPTLKLSEKDKVLTAQKISELSLNHESETVNVILGDKMYEGKRFIGTQGGSNKAYYTQIGDKLYYIKYPTKDKLGQSVEEVIASRLYRAAGIDSPNMEYVYNENGQIIGMAGEYVPQLKNAPYNREQFTDGFAVDAWLANWDAPKNDNTQYREDGVIKVDVGGSLHYRAKGEMKDFTQTVNELSTLIEQNSSFLTMTKEELMNSLQHVINTPDEAIYKIIQESPLDDKRIIKTLIKRKEYITIFAKQLASLDESQYANIFDLVNAAKIKTAQEFKEDINISELLGYDRTKTGFEGLLNTTGDKEQTLTEEQQELVDKLIAEIKKFTIENRVADNLPISQDLRDFLNSILKGIPEFAAIFEKPQHTNQDYTLDVHILKVLQDSIKDPLYNQLSDTGKIILKFSTLLHDISKRYLLEGSDKGHAAKSSEYVYSILDRFNFPQEVKNRIIAIVENHHWFQAYNLKNIGEKEIATLCRNQEDFLIYQIMAKADLKNVNKNFYMEKTHASSFEEAEEKFAEEIARIQPYVDKLAQSQVVITSSKFVQVPERVTSSGRVLPAREFPKEKVNINGVETEIPVLNLSQMDENTNLYQYGFDNITLKDLRLNVHMVANDRIYLDIFKTLAQNPMNNSAQSISLISMDNKSTYCNLKYGLVLDVSNENVSYAYYANTSSGYKKGFDDFVHEMFANNAYRAFVKDNFKSRMTEKGYELSDKEYAAISKYMSKKQYPEKQIKSLKIGDKIFRKEDLIDAFVYSRDQLIEQNKIKTHGSHNEIVALNSRIVGVIAKENSINDCPGWLLKFAKDNNLPVFLVGQ